MSLTQGGHNGRNRDTEDLWSKELDFPFLQFYI